MIHFGLKFCCFCVYQRVNAYSSPFYCTFLLKLHSSNTNSHICRYISTEIKLKLKLRALWYYFVISTRLNNLLSCSLKSSVHTDQKERNFFFQILCIVYNKRWTYKGVEIPLIKNYSSVKHFWCVKIRREKKVLWFTPQTIHTDAKHFAHLKCIDKNVCFDSFGVKTYWIVRTSVYRRM